MSSTTGTAVTSLWARVAATALNVASVRTWTTGRVMRSPIVRCCMTASHAVGREAGRPARGCVPLHRHEHLGPSAGGGAGGAQRGLRGDGPGYGDDSTMSAAGAPPPAPAWAPCHLRLRDSHSSYGCRCSLFHTDDGPARRTAAQGGRPAGRRVSEPGRLPIPGERRRRGRPRAERSAGSPNQASPARRRPCPGGPPPGVRPLGKRG